MTASLTGKVWQVSAKPASTSLPFEEAFAFAESLGLEPRVQVPGSVADGVRNPLDFSATPVNYRVPPPAGHI